jgi:hypothetical protein
VEAVRHCRAVMGAIRALQTMDDDELYVFAKEIRAPGGVGRGWWGRRTGVLDEPLGQEGSDCSWRGCYPIMAC